MTRRLFAVVGLLPVAFIATGARSDYVSIKQKFDAIENYRLQPGTRVPIASNELNAYVQAELPKVAPPGVRSPSVELHGDNTATGRAVVNFLTLRNARGKPPNWLMRKLLEGERDVAVTAHLQSGNGNAVVHVRRVEISGIPIEGAALDFLINNYVIPNYPDAKIGRPFPLRYGMDRLEVKPGRVEVVMRSPRLR